MSFLIHGNHLNVSSVSLTCITTFKLVEITVPKKIIKNLVTVSTQCNIYKKIKIVLQKLQSIFVGTKNPIKVPIIPVSYLIKNYFVEIRLSKLKTKKNKCKHWICLLFRYYLYHKNFKQKTI